MSFLLSLILACISPPDYRPFTVYNDAHQSIVRIVQATTGRPRQVRYLKLWKPIPADANDDTSAELVGNAPDVRIFTFTFKDGAAVSSPAVDPGRIRAMRVGDQKVVIVFPTSRPKKP